MTRLVVDPVTRIEGHLRIEIDVKDGAVVDGSFHAPTAKELEKTDVIVFYKGDMGYMSDKEKADLEASLQRIERGNKATLGLFRKFLDCIERNVPAELDIHTVMDNASSHKTRRIRNWFAKRPRWHVHFTPTSASWINQVERFFALITERKIRRGIYRSVAALRAEILELVTLYTAAAFPDRPFVPGTVTGAVTGTVPVSGKVFDAAEA